MLVAFKLVTVPPVPVADNFPSASKVIPAPNAIGAANQASDVAATTGALQGLGGAQA